MRRRKMPSEKVIKSLLPKGFKLVVEETFQSEALGARIFVFQNKEDQRLYCKLCSQSDIAKGFIWEVLNPASLKLLGIEESYNQTLHNEGYSVEESVSDDLWDPEQETLEEYKARTGREPKRGSISGKGIKDLANRAGEVNIYVSGKNESEGNQSQEDLESENEDLKNKLSLLAQAEFEAKKKRLGAPSQITSPEKLKEWEEEQRALQSGDPIRQPSSGSLGLQDNLVNSEGYDSHEELIDDLRKRARSKDPKISQEADAVLKELWRKMIAGKESFKEKDFKINREHKGNFIRRKEEDD
jgi:hypothetical protein